MHDQPHNIADFRDNPVPRQLPGEVRVETELSEQELTA
jgi:hypothetical protein